MKKPGKMASEVLRHVLKKPATIKYPYEKVQMPPKFRGKLKFSPEKCVGCKLCMRDCPANAIENVKVGEKQFDSIVNLDRCLYCMQCVLSCAKKALDFTDEYELAALDRKSLRVKINEKA